MVKTHLKISLFSAVLSSLMASSASAGGAFMTASKPSCHEVVMTVKGRINYKESIKNGELGFHHCIHNKLKSADFPAVAPANSYCSQVDMEPEVVSINPPLPHEGNATLPVFHRPNPYYIPDGSVCEVKYAQYYFLR